MKKIVLYVPATSPAKKKFYKLSEINADLFDSESDSDNDKENKRDSSSSDNEENMETEGNKSEENDDDDDDEPVEMSAALKRRLMMVKISFILEML